MNSLNMLNLHLPNIRLRSTFLQEQRTQLKYDWKYPRPSSFSSIITKSRIRQSYVLVGWDRRLYGRDSVGGEWHRHPYQNPLEHDTSREGAKAVTPPEFLKEVLDILHEEELL